MNLRNVLMDALENRVSELERQKADGAKIIAYVAGNFMPAELVEACGGISVLMGLVKGGEHEPVVAAEAYLPRFLETFCKAQTGYKMLGSDHIYGMPDLLVVPVVNVNVRALSDAWEVYSEVDVFRFGVPRKRSEHGFRFYLEGLNELKDRLEKTTGIDYDEEKLKKAIDSSNKLNDMLLSLSLTRRSKHPAISGRDFALINHASYVLENDTLSNLLEPLIKEVDEKENVNNKSVRILLKGAFLASGDYRIFDLIEDAGGSVVIEDFWEGIRNYREKIEVNSDPLMALADKYYRRAPIGAFVRPSTKKGIELLNKLAKDFKVDGVIWYQTMYDECYDMDSDYIMSEASVDFDLPIHKIQTSYDPFEVGALKSRVETFIENIRSRKEA